MGTSDLADAIVLEWIEPESLPDAEALREFAGGPLSDGTAYLRCARAIVAAHEIGEEEGGLSAETLHHARLGLLQILADLERVLPHLGGAWRDPGYRVAVEDAHALSPEERERVRAAILEAIAFVGIEDPVVRRLLILLEPAHSER